MAPEFQSSYQRFVRRWLQAQTLITIVLLAGGALYGLSLADPAGGLLIACIPTALVTVLGVGIASAGDLGLRRWSRTLWVATSIVALAGAEAFANTSEEHALEGAQILLSCVMIVLTFPSGLLAAYPMYGISHFGVRFGGKVESVLLLWVLFGMFGFVQWFVLLPGLFGWWRGRPRSATTTLK